MREPAIIIGFHIRNGLFRVLAAALTVMAVTATLSGPVAAGPEDRKTIVLDPGHGGSDTGARGTGGLNEKDVTLALAQRTAACLASRYEAVLTRSGDYQVETTDRVALANARRAGLYISIHGGAGFSSGPGGIMIFYGGGLSEDALAGIHAEKPPEAGSQAAGSDAWEAVQERHADASRGLAALMREALIPLARNGEVTVRQAPLAPLAGADMPAVMVEVGPLTDPVAEDRLRDPAYLSTLAQVLCASVDRFFGAP
ncbi:MAG: N-acetylmuramoyl-L-alanine amidase family protein [Thermodesulfobacteriota bacterium]